LLLLNIILLIPTLLVWFYFSLLTVSQHNSDAAGNAIGRAYTALAGILLGILITALLIFAGMDNQLPGWSGVIALLLLPASVAAVTASLNVMVRNEKINWIVIVPAGLPGIAIAFSIWCLLPSAVHAAISPPLIRLVCLAGILLLLPLPLIARYQHKLSLPTPEQIAVADAKRQEESARQYEQGFRALTPDSAFSDWWMYTDEKNPYRTEALAGARTARNRQQEIPPLLADARAPVYFALPTLDLTVTPEIEQGVRAFLHDQVTHLKPYDPAHPMATSVVTEWFERYFPTLQWFIENHGNIDEELTAIAAAVSQYPDGPELQKFLESLARFSTRS
jgi:hypothetical protein